MKCKGNMQTTAMTHMPKTTRQFSEAVSKMLKVKAEAQEMKRKLSGNDNPKLRDIWE